MHLLDGPRAREAFVLRVVMAAPWALRVEDRAPLSVMCVLRGGATLVPDGGETVRLEAGDVGAVRGPTAYVVADDPHTPVHVRVLPGQVCVDPEGELLDRSMALGPRTWGNARTGDCELLVGTWHADAEVSRPLLDALPAVLVRRPAGRDAAVVELLASEAREAEPGQQAVLDRLLDLVLLGLVRSWVGEEPGAVPSLARHDPAVQQALGLIQQHHEHPWTLVALARECQVSRATLARRFTATVGEAPMGYLTRWRIARAADLLVSGEESLESVARRVGYGSGFALSTAFKRERGISPREHRLRVRLPPA